MKGIYLDHAATTRLRPEILVAMVPYFSEEFGNALSPHGFGAPAAAAVAAARQRIAAVLKASPEEIHFTSGGTESDNLAILGIARAQKHAGRGNHIITSAIEHPAVLETCRYLERYEGFRVTYLAVDFLGRVPVSAVAEALAPDTVLVTIMAVNNVVGTIQPIEAIGSLARSRGIPVHSDAVQAVGKMPLDLSALPIDALSLSGHKFYGPKGVGIVFLRQGTPYLPASHGAGHERGVRSGTHNTPGIVGLALALEMAVAEAETVGRRLQRLETTLLVFIGSNFPGALHVGHPCKRAVGSLTFSFPGLIGFHLLEALSERGIAVSSGPACHADEPQPQPVLTALGLTAEQAVGSIRITMGRETKAREITYLMQELPDAVAAARAREPLPVSI